MPECQNCGSFVSETFANVHTQNGGNPMSCANCEANAETENATA